MEKLHKWAARAEKSADKHFKSIPRELSDVALSSPPKGAPKWAVDASFLKIASSSTDVESGSGIDRMYSFQLTTPRSSEPESSDFELLDSDWIAFLSLCSLFIVEVQYLSKNQKINNY